MIAEVLTAKVTWVMRDIERPGGCEVAEWCGGGCEAPDGMDTVSHGREVAVAMLGDRPLFVIDIAQKKAVRPWRDGGTGWYRNTDQAPYVFIAVFGGGEPRRGTALTWRGASILAEVAGCAGAGDLCDAIAAAARFAERIDSARSALDVSHQGALR